MVLEDNVENKGTIKKADVKVLLFETVRIR